MPDQISMILTWEPGIMSLLTSGEDPVQVALSVAKTMRRHGLPEAKFLSWILSIKETKDWTATQRTSIIAMAPTVFTGPTILKPLRFCLLSEAMQIEFQFGTVTVPSTWTSSRAALQDCVRKQTGHEINHAGSVDQLVEHLSSSDPWDNRTIIDRIYGDVLSGGIGLLRRQTKINIQAMITDGYMIVEKPPNPTYLISKAALWKRYMINEINHEGAYLDLECIGPGLRLCYRFAPVLMRGIRPMKPVRIREQKRK